MIENFRSLDKVKEWLLGLKSPLTEDMAHTLFFGVVPAIVDLETRAVRLKADEVSQKIIASAGILEEQAEQWYQKLAEREAVLEFMHREKEREATMPESCAECEHAKPLYELGVYSLRCQFSKGTRHDPPLAVIDPQISFNQPRDVTLQQLVSSVRPLPPPTWCPLRL